MTKHYQIKFYLKYQIFLLFLTCLLVESYSQDTFHIAEKIIHFKPPTSFKNGMRNDKMKNFIKTFSYGNNITIGYYLKEDVLARFEEKLDLDLTNQIKIFIPQNLIGKNMSTTSINELYSSMLESYIGDNYADIQKKGESYFNKKLIENGYLDNISLNKPVFLDGSLINNKTFFLVIANSGYLKDDTSKKMIFIQSMIVKIVQGQLIFTIYQQELQNFTKDLKTVKEISNEIISSLY